MTFNALMLPALPPTSAAGLKTAGNFGPTTLKSGRLSESAQGRRSFRDTLNDVSIRPYDSHPKSAPAKMRAEISAAPGKELQVSAKTGDAANDSPNRVEENETNASAGGSADRCSCRIFGMVHPGIFGFSMADDGSFPNAAVSEATDGSRSVFIDNLMGYFQPEGQGSLVDWLARGGSFEPLQADISPEAGSYYAFEQLAAQGATNQGLGAMMDAQAEFIDLSRWQAFLPQITLINPAGAPGGDGKALLAALLQMQQAIGAAPGLNAETVEAAGQDAGNYPEAANPEAAKWNEDLLFKMTLPSLPAESDLLENAKSVENAKEAGAGKDARMTWWVAADPNSETPLQTPSRQLFENSRLPGMQADPKAAAEQSANPNAVAESVITKPADDLLSFKDPVLKAESLLLAESGSKITPVEGDGRDGSFLFAQDHMPEHLKTLESAMRTLEGARSGLTSQATDQIVQKAVLLLNNNQHEVHIELKPEFLGHIRMQIVNESQQVTIKIVTEFAFVKDMLESNLNQLKAELQAQGLEIDELEVSVAHDSYADGDDLHQKTAEIAKFRDASGNDAADEEPSEKRKQSQNANGEANGETAIDYFA